jgi:hypothetical protein
MTRTQPGLGGVTAPKPAARLRDGLPATQRIIFGVIDGIPGRPQLINELLRPPVDTHHRACLSCSHTSGRIRTALPVGARAQLRIDPVHESDPSRTTALCTRRMPRNWTVSPATSRLPLPRQDPVRRCSRIVPARPGTVTVGVQPVQHMITIRDPTVAGAVAGLHIPRHTLAASGVLDQIAVPSASGQPVQRHHVGSPTHSDRRSHTRPIGGQAYQPEGTASPSARRVNLAEDHFGVQWAENGLVVRRRRFLWCG